jgi:hypothetical protein
LGEGLLGRPQGPKFFPNIKIWELEKATIRSLDYLIEHQPQKIIGLHFIGITRL